MDGILITAGAKRLGASIAHWAVSQNLRVHLHYHTSHDEAHALKLELEKKGGHVFLHQANFLDEEEVLSLVGACVQEGPLALLVNNASLFQYDSAQTVSGLHLDQHFTVNAKAPALLIRALYEAVGEQGSAAVINVTDARLQSLNIDYYAYTLSQFALDGLTKQAALGYAPRLRVNAIAPHVFLPNAAVERDVNEYNQLNLLQKSVSVDDVLRAVDFLYHTPSITGTTLLLDAGVQFMPMQRDPAFTDGV